MHEDQRRLVLDLRTFANHCDARARRGLERVEQRSSPESDRLTLRQHRNTPLTMSADNTSRQEVKMSAAVSLMRKLPWGYAHRPASIVVKDALIPIGADPHALTQSRKPMDISQTPARLRTPNESAFTPIGITGHEPPEICDRPCLSLPAFAGFASASTMSTLRARPTTSSRSTRKGGGR
jgi:hypothetical protein